MSDVWFTADLHLNHFKAVEYSKRPFDTLEEMEEALVRNWNECVKAGDRIFCLGDFALTRNHPDRDRISSIFHRLNGVKHLVVGNHDDPRLVRDIGWHEVTPYRELKIDMGGERRQKICLMHYPIRSWNGIHRGAWMLHGHCHGNLADRGGKLLDVGVDCHKYRPINLEVVSAIMATRPIRSEDHHQPQEKK